MEVAVKRMTVPKSMHDRCVLHDIFTEIMVMDKFKNDPKIVHLYDYGVDEENFWIIMRLYKDSLKGWLKRQRTPWFENLPLYLNIYEKVLETMLFLTQNRTSFIVCVLVVCVLVVCVRVVCGGACDWLTAGPYPQMSTTTISSATTSCVTRSTPTRRTRISTTSPPTCPTSSSSLLVRSQFTPHIARMPQVKQV
jgi:hypothetical protein